MKHLNTLAHDRHTSFYVGLLIALTSSMLTYCGSNVFKSGEKKDPAEDATLALEDKNPSSAIKILEAALKKDDGNPQYLSILSTAYAQRAGVEPLTMVRNMSGNNSSSLTDSTTSSNSSLVGMFGIVPAATTDSVSDISRAVSILTVELPQSQWQPGDQFKLAIYQVAASVMRLKILDTDGDGKLSVAEIAVLTSGGSLISQLAASQSILAQNTSDQTSVSAAQALAKHQADIAASPGSTDDEKLKNYLAKSSGNTTSLQEDR